MKRTHLIGLTITSLLVLASAARIVHAGDAARASANSRTCSEAIASFLKEPTARNYDEMRRLKADACSSTLTNSQIQSLDHLTAGGNKLAAQLLAPAVRRLDGGELEDALRALGRYSVYDMRSFLSMVATGSLTQHEASDALTMLPLELEDQFDAQLAALRTRRTAVEKVHDAQLQGAAKSAIEAIDNSITEVEAARTGQRASK